MATAVVAAATKGHASAASCRLTRPIAVRRRECSSGLWAESQSEGTGIRCRERGVGGGDWGRPAAGGGAGCGLGRVGAGGFGCVLSLREGGVAASLAPSAGGQVIGPIADGARGLSSGVRGAAAGPRWTAPP